VAKAFKDAVHQRVLDETGSERRKRDLDVEFFVVITIAQRWIASVAFIFVASRL
jgi:hypothetical protein